MRCAEIKRVLSDIFLFKNLNEDILLVQPCRDVDLTLAWLIGTD